jgi:hypothetical protein
MESVQQITVLPADAYPLKEHVVGSRRPGRAIRKVAGRPGCASVTC